MNDDGRQPPCDGEDDSDIRDLMRESDYGGRLRDDFKRDLLRELNHNFKYHPLHSRVLLAAVVVLVAGLAMWRATDVGSGGFNLRPTGHSAAGDPVVEEPLTGVRLNAPAVDGSTDKGVTAAQELYEQISAHDAKVTRLEIWVIGGESAQFVQLEVVRNGETIQVMRGIGGSKRFDRQWRAFRTGSGRAALDAIEHRGVAPEATESVRFMDRDFEMGVWSWDTPDMGRVVYKRSLP